MKALKSSSESACFSKTTNRTAQKYALVLSALLALFCLRVIGQLIVACWSVPWLPAMDKWMSGLLPYPLLLTAQVLIIALFGKVCRDFATGKGFFLEHHKSFSKLVGFGWMYVMAMLLRYTLCMTLYPAERWTGGAIPIFFHLVLASFLITVGRYHAIGATKAASS